MQLDRDMLVDYQNRWRAVVEMELEEQRQNSFAERWRQLNLLVRMASALGLQAAYDESQVQDVRRRWNLLRDMYLRQEKRS